MTADKTFTFEATQDELLALMKSAARTELQNPGAFEALLLRNFVPRPRDAEATPEETAIAVPLDLFRDVLTVAATYNYELFSKLWDLRWGLASDDKADPS